MAKTKKANEPKSEKPRDVTGWRRVNRIQLSELLGVHPDTISDFARQGMPVQNSGGRGRESVYDAVACLDWWRQRQGKNAKENAQTRAYEATAKLNELKLARERGELVPRDQVIAEGQTYTKGWTALVRGLPRRLRQAGVITAAEESAVAGECRQLLLEISTWKTAADVERSVKEHDAA